MHLENECTFHEKHQDMYKYNMHQIDVQKNPFFIYWKQNFPNLQKVSSNFDHFVKRNALL